MLGKITNSVSKYNILAPVYVCEDNNTLLFIRETSLGCFQMVSTSLIIILLLLVTT